MIIIVEIWIHKNIADESTCYRHGLFQFKYIVYKRTRVLALNAHITDMHTHTYTDTFLPSPISKPFLAVYNKVGG